jgi:hypothetical protein
MQCIQMERDHQLYTAFPVRKYRWRSKLRPDQQFRLPEVLGSLPVPVGTGTYRLSLEMFVTQPDQQST